MTEISRELRHQHEAEVYDAMGAELLASMTPSDLHSSRDEIPFHNHEQVDILTCALDVIRPLEGTRILEIGVGSGMLATYLALQGAHVTGIDVSSTILEVARRRAQANGVDERVTLHKVSAEDFDAPDASFDSILGNNVLHHLDLEGSGPNLARLLRPGGRASFCEPVLFLPPGARRIRESKLVRRRFPSHTHTPDEKSLGLDDIRLVSSAFASAHWRPFHLLCRLQNFVELSEPTFARLENIDRHVLKRIRPSAFLCRSVVLALSVDDDATPPDAQFRKL